MSAVGFNHRYLVRNFSIPDPFTPTSITGLVAWYDASVPGSITSSSGAVSQWNDLSSSGFNVVQATGSKQPTTGTRTQNGLNVLDFDGTANSLARAATTLTSAGLWTTFAVALTDTTANPRNIVDQDGAVRKAQYIRQNSSTLESIAFDTLGNPFIDSQGTSLSAATAYVFTALHAASTVEVFLNGSGNGSTATTGTNASGSAELIIGATNGSTNQFWDGWIAEVLFYDAALSTSDRNSVEAYLKAKWGT